MNEIACYIRVSTDKEEQLKSLEQQKVLLENQYKNVLMYSDTGTGTSFDRKGFQQLMYDAGLNKKVLKDGRLTFEVDALRNPIFNEIVVLSTSRFARNILIVDVLRLLWDYKKVNVRFLDIQKDSKNINDMMVLQMYFVTAENEAKEISERTKRGNKTSIIKNKIRNNSIFGWDFNKENNSLIRNEEEAKAVEFIFETALTNGLKNTAKLTNERGYRTKKGNLWTDSTIKTLITNPKYKGYNVRNKFNNVNLFTESKTQYVKKEDWIVQYNDRIEPLVSEELWNNVQIALHDRCIHGNRGKNSSKYDTSGKIKCGKCGATYVRCVENRVDDKPINQHYMICSHKKKYSKVYCDAENITIKMIDDYIEEQRKTYYKKIRTQIQLKIISLQNELSSLSKSNKADVVNIIKAKESKVAYLKDKIEKLLDNFIQDESSQAIKDTITRKIKVIELEVVSLEKDLRTLKMETTDRELHSKKISMKINKLKEELNDIPDGELTRKEWMDKTKKIIVNGKNDYSVEYDLD